MSGSNLLSKSTWLCIGIFVIGILLVSSPFAAAQFLSQEEDVIRAITFEGNDHIDRDLLMGHLNYTRIGQTITADGLRNDAQNIVDLGWFEEVDPRVDPFLGGVRVTFVVKEFPVIEDIEVVVEGGVVAPESIEPLLGVTRGEVLNIAHLSYAIEELPWRAAEEVGYFIDPVAVDFYGERGEHLVVHVRPLYVGEIIIEGNEKTRDYVILRELTIKEGDLFSMTEIRNSLRRLGQLGFFEPIIPEFLPTADPQVVDLLLPVIETKTGSASFGAGYSSRDGLLGFIELSDNNLFGRGQRAAVKWEFGGKSNTYDLSFAEPYLFGTTTSLALNVYRVKRMYEREQYTADSTGGEITFGRPLGVFTRGYLTYRMDNVSRTPQSGSLIPESSNKTRSFIARVNTDTTDHLFYPTEGYRFEVSGEFARPIFDGDTLFEKYQSSFSTYRKVGGNNQTVATRAIVGFSNGTLPIENKYRVGGAETVRGYRYGEMIGDRMFVAQAEYRIPFSDQVSGVIFADSGNAWEGDAGINLMQLKFGYGVGIRFDTPLGVIRLDYGIGERGGEAYFSLGPTF